MKRKAHFSRLMSLLLIGAFAAAFANSKNGQLLKYKFDKGDKLIYSWSKNIETVQEIGGQKQESKTTMDAKVRFTGESSLVEGATFSVVYDAMTFDVNHPALTRKVENPEGLIGKRIRKSIAANGDLIKSEELDPIDVGVLAQFGFSTDGEWFPNLPAEALSVGKTVRATDVDTSKTKDRMTIVSSTYAYTLLGSEKKNGYKCLKISVASTSKIQGDGLLQGLEFVMTGKGSAKETLYFAPKKGVLILAETESQSNLMIDISSQGLKIPIVQSEKSTLALVK